MAKLKLVSECFVKPKYEVEAAKQHYHLSPVEIAMLSIHPIQKGLLFSLNNNNHTSSDDDDDRKKLVSHLLEKLKHSLSIALVHFYPLAGRFETIRYPDEHACSIFVDCNKGPGASLVHTTALDVTISDVMCSSDDVPKIVLSMFELGEKSVNYDGHTRPLLSIQVTELLDGVFIGFSMNHCVVDGTSFIHFVNMLSEIFRSECNAGVTNISRVPIYNYKPWVGSAINSNKDLSVLIHNYDPLVGSATNSNKDLSIVKLPFLEPEEFIVRERDPTPLKERIFHFSSKAMAALKAKANQECATQNVTISSFQALSALVWRSITRARNLESDGSGQLTSCSMLINARTRLEPPLNEDYFGNFIWGAKIDCNVGELLSNNLGWVAMLLRQEIMEQDNEKIIGFYKFLAESPFVAQPGVGQDVHGPNKVVIGGSAWFDMYGPEFGLGRALGTRMGFANKEDGKVTANPGCEGGGSVDLEICLKSHFMDALVVNSEFMSFVLL